MSTPSPAPEAPAGASPPASFGAALWWLVVAVWAFACLHYPLGRDQGIFSWVGDVVAEGGVPYRDAWEVKGPLLYYVFGALRALSGPGIMGIRAFDLLVLALGARATTRVAGPRAAGLLVLWYASGTFWDTCQADGWTGLVLAMWVAWLGATRDRSPGLEIAGTALVGAVVLGLKPPLVVLGLLYPIYLRTLRGEPWGTALGRGLAAALGTTLLGALGAAALHQAGGLEPMLQIYSCFLLGDYAEVYPSGVGLHLARLAKFYLLKPQFPLALLSIAAVTWLRPDPRARFMLAWLVLGTLCVAAQGRYFSYHWMVLYPALAVLVQDGLGALTVGPSWRRGLGSMLGLVTWILAGGLPAIEGLRTVRFYTRGHTRAQYVRAYGGPAHYPGADYEEAARYVLAHTPEGSSVMLWGMDGAVNALTGRPGVGRWGLSFRLFVNPDPKIQAEYRADFLAAFDAEPPGAVLIVEGDAIPYLKPRESRDYLPDFPEFEARLAAGYRSAARFGRVEVLLPGPGQGHGGGTPRPPDATTPRSETGASSKES